MQLVIDFGFHPSSMKDADTMPVAGFFERGPAAKSTRAELYGDEYVEKCFRHLEAHERCESSEIGSIVLPARLYFSPCIKRLALRYTWSV